MFKTFLAAYLTPVVVLALSGPAQAEGTTPGKLHVLEAPGTYEALVGDLVEITESAYTDSGPQYRVTNLKVSIVGDSVFPRTTTVVLVPPKDSAPGAPRIFGASSTLRAYLPAENVGTATVTVTPIGADGKPKESKTFTVRVGRP